MDRRSFVKTGAAATVAAGTKIKAQRKTKRKKPNILFVFGDQHRSQSLPGEPFDQTIAPNFEKFHRANFSMDTCVSNYPLCTPWRGIFVSGRWPQQTGLIYNNVPLKPEDGTLGHTFADNGYYTGYIGKWHLAGHGEDPGFIPKGPRRMGFEYWQAWDRTNEHYHAPTYDQNTGQKIVPEGWQPTNMTDEAVSFLKQQTKERPWFLALSWNPPHPPYNPPAEDQASYAGKLKFRPNVRLRPGLKVPNEQRFLQSEEMLHQAMAGSYGGITGIDKEFGRLLQTLDEVGQAEDTIVIYSSDHGDMMGSQGRLAKQVPFEESCRVPFLIRYPGVTPAGGRNEVLFQAVDIYPTLCGLAGIPVPATCVGRDLSGVMRGGKTPDIEYAFLMNQVDGGPDAPEHGPAGGNGHGGTLRFINQPSYRGVRTRTHTYAVTETGRWLLYDNVADPYQMKNLVSDPVQKPLMEKLDAEILRWLKSLSDPFPYAENTKRISDFPSS